MNFTPAPTPSAAADDATLVARYVAGDDAAFTPLLERHQRRVFTLLMMLVRDRALAEDLTQETFFKAIRALQAGESYVEAGKFGAWVCCIARRLALDAIRHQQRGAFLSLDRLAADRITTTLPAGYTACTETSPTPEELLMREDTRESLRRVIEQLPLKQRQVLLMRHYAEMTFTQIADATGVNVNTTLSRMRMAMESLRRRINPATLLAAALLTTSNTISSPPPLSNHHDSTFYARDADPVRL